MIVNPQKLLETVTKQIARIDERSPGYKKDLLETISEILALERQNQEQGINIRQKIFDKCDALGKLVAGRTKGAT